MKKKLLYLLIIALFFVIGFFALKLMRHNNEQIPTITVSSPAIKLSDAISIPDTVKKVTIEVHSSLKPAESTISGTILSGYSKDNKLLFSAGFPLTWNTYSANQPGEIHLFVRTPNMDSPFSALPRTINNLHNAYLMKTNKNLLVFGMPGGGYSKIEQSPDNQYVFNDKQISATPESFKNMGYAYSIIYGNDGVGMLDACKLTNPDICDKISISPPYVIFAYGGNERNTVAITNNGEVLFHNMQGWCRGEKTNGGFKCNKNADSFLLNKGLQLYSSVKTEYGTLLGDFPTGRFWLLGDGILEPTSLSPYSDPNAQNIELQSVSLFCGNLYAGFWPYGEVWERHLDSGIWKKSLRLFSHPTNTKSGNVPYEYELRKLGNSPYDSNRFFGQRATSMANYKNSLFVASGNLGAWNQNIPKPAFMTDSQINEYGMVYSKTDSNCLTTVIDGNIAMKITIDSNNIYVYNNGSEIASTKLHDFDIKQIDHFHIGQGVFGPISDKGINVKVMGN